MIYHLNQYNDHRHATLLDKRFNTTILHLTFYELDGNSKAQWLLRMDAIVKFIGQNNIKLVIIDAGGDPCDIDYNHQGYSTSYREMLNMLNEHCRTIIITDDWNYWYNVHDDIRFFSQGLYFLSKRNIDQYWDYQDTVYDTTIEKSKSLMCLNRNLEWHRIYLLYLLHNKAWFKDIDYSFILQLQDKLFVPSGSNSQKPLFTENEIQTLKSIELPINLQNETTPNIPIMCAEGASSVNLPVYRDNAINLITETTTGNNGICLTEKTAKPIMAFQIPILIGNPGASQWLEDVGIDMFSDYVPWKQWDNIDDPKLRIRIIVEYVDEIMQDPNQILLKHKSFHSRLIANKQRFHSDEFADSLIQQLG